MKLVVGLGNPGKEHADNRHNLGHRIVGHWVLARGERFQEETKFRSLAAKFALGDETVVALLPLTYMNRSGEAVQKAMAFYKIAVNDVIVLHDELDIPSGTFRMKRGGGPGGNNGLRSIHTVGDEYLRIRLGVGRPPVPEMDPADFVLGNLTFSEKKIWEALYPSVAEALELCIAGREPEAMKRFHTKPKE